MSQTPARVVVFGLGGTIAMTPTATGGVTPTLSADDLVNAVPELAQTGISIDVVDFRRIPGASIGFADLDELLAAVDQCFQEGAAGAVITEGTDPIEEVAYYLDLRYSGPNPVVVTGAMRNPAMAGADGPANLLAAILTAAAPTARGHGVLVALNDEIHLASQVRKTHTTATSAFGSPNSSAYALLVEGQPRWLHRPSTRLTVPYADSGRTGRRPVVAVHTAMLDDEPTLVDGIEERVDGLIVAGMGVGHVHAALVEPLAKAAARIPVILSSRIGRGPSLTRTYAFKGSERDLIEHGLISAGFLDPLKARILLRTLLSSYATLAQTKQAFAAAGNTADIPWPWPQTGEA
ncbi:asparaginase [Catellatospora sp. NPDC049111]|uniref:asparaginase n=1 Tax=Catellatospora sp. NPDC049111 TaxID=3155271 RepID=UPI0033E52171